MNLKECYKKLGGDYDEVLTRLYSEDMIRRFLIKFFKRWNLQAFIREA